MLLNDKNISYRIYFVAFAMFLFAMVIVFKLTNIQWVHGEHYRKLAKQNSLKTFVVPANKGSIYSSDGSLLAVSVPIYIVRFDAVSPSDKVFNENLNALSDSLALLFGKNSSFFENKLKAARRNKNRFLLLGKDLSYTQYARLKSFPILKLGIYKGGRMDSIREVRKHPIGEIAERTIGYIGLDKNGNKNGVGIEGAFGKYLNGKDGKVIKQKIAKGQYKPIRDENVVEPVDGHDIVSTLNVYIQDIAHHALLQSLQKNKAEHGCVIVMETKTGHIKAISNLGRTEKDSIYKEKLNYAIREQGEPGSTFKLVDMIALLDDNKLDTSKVYNRRGGSITYFGNDVVDSHREGEQRISLAKGFEISSNTVMVQAVYENYKNNPKQFVDRINKMGLNKPLGLSLKGEGIPIIPQPGTPKWNGLSLPWMAFGYGIEVTPMQTLTLYNAIANNGEMVKPQFVSEIKEWNKTIKKFDKEVINPKICSETTIKKLKAVMENVVKRGTAKSIYSKDFPMAGKTGTAQGNYGINGGADKHYISSFVGFFPVNEPKYTCIVVVHKPSTATGSYYGADVAGPVFKRIAQKIFTDSPSTNEIKNLNKKNTNQEKQYNGYFSKAQIEKNIIPNVKGMSAMDAVALLENMGLKVKLKGKGVGKVKSQSLNSGNHLIRQSEIKLELN
ncbi:penicillin-binding protein [Flavobacterium luteum]|uniref:Transpeptidase family protein n=1 Tax=Flavobacterium luteum TaxID=2026654 RepID=A0A7J5AKD9_9FLAO|nr:penicillin-binding protein [Flavobacterium luteum]KAB1157950.1 transpeptidase family protein [Flavobacterium luteum]